MHRVDPNFPTRAHRLAALNDSLGSLELDSTRDSDRKQFEDVYQYFSVVEEQKNFDEVPDRMWRKLPTGIGGNAEKSILQLKNVCAFYWREKLEKLRTDKSKRWLRPLAACYLWHYQPDTPDFKGFFSPLEKFLLRHVDALGAGFKGLLEIGVFEKENGPRKFAKFLMAGPHDIDAVTQQHKLWADFPLSNFAATAFTCLNSIEASLLRSPQGTKNLLSWMGPPQAPRYPALTAFTAEVILLPWVGQLPPVAQMNPLRSFILENPYLGNPDRQNPNWVNVNTECKEIFKKWMISQSLDAFFEVLQNTADDLWRYREKFWRTYFSLGAIEDVWLVLGKDAEYFVKRNPKKYGHLRFGTFYDTSGGVARNHSLLLIRIGDIEFAEWSHNGSLRARYLTGDRLNKPSRCDGSDYKYDSLDFHDGMNERPQLAHHQSANGGWQDKARKFIRKHTNVNAQLPDLCI